MNASEFLCEDALTKRVTEQTGLLFSQLWEHVHVHFYAVPEEPGAARDLLLADPTPWRLRLIPDGLLPLPVLLDPSHRSLLTAWALLRWLVEADPHGPLAVKARAEVDRETHLRLTIAGAAQAHKNRTIAKLPRKKRGQPTHLDQVKRLMRRHRNEHGLSFDEFLRQAEAGAVDGLSVRYDRATDNYSVHVLDFAEEPLAPRRLGAMKDWYYPPT